MKDKIHILPQEELQKSSNKKNVKVMATKIYRNTNYKSKIILHRTTLTTTETMVSHLEKHTRITIITFCRLRFGHNSSIFHLHRIHYTYQPASDCDRISLSNINCSSIESRNVAIDMHSYLLSTVTPFEQLNLNVWMCFGESYFLHITS
jgi:hypothetical protein